MNVARVNLTEEQAKYLLPGRIQGMLKVPSTNVFAVMDGDRIAALAVVLASDNVMASFSIGYIRAEEGYGADELKMLLDYIEKVLKDNGERLVTARLIGDADEIVELHNSMEEAQYTALQLDGRHVMYYVQDIKETEFAQMLDRTEALTASVYSFNELDKKQITVFAEKMKKSALHKDFKIPDLVFGRFFVVGGEIKGFMDITEEAPGVLLLSDYYIEKDPKAKYALPAMIASMLKVIDAFMPDDAALYIQIYKDDVYQNFKNVFGEAEVDQVIFEYAKKL